MYDDYASQQIQERQQQWEQQQQQNQINQQQRQIQQMQQDQQLQQQRQQNQQYTQQTQHQYPNSANPNTTQNYSQQTAQNNSTLTQNHDSLFFGISVLIIMVIFFRRDKTKDTGPVRMLLRWSIRAIGVVIIVFAFAVWLTIKGLI